MVQTISDFAEASRKRLGIAVRCSCGKSCTFRCADFDGYIAPGQDIEALTWRCTWCRAVTTNVWYAQIDKVDRRDLVQWTPPKGRKRRW